MENLTPISTRELSKTFVIMRVLRGGAPKRNFGERRGHRGGNNQRSFEVKKLLSEKSNIFNPYIDSVIIIHFNKTPLAKKR